MTRDELIAALPSAMHKLRSVDAFDLAQQVSDAADMLERDADDIAMEKLLFDKLNIFAGKCERERDAARAECDALRKDAERYRIIRYNLRGPEPFCTTPGAWYVEHGMYIGGRSQDARYVRDPISTAIRLDIETDAAIDAAIRALKEDK